VVLSTLCPRVGASVGLMGFGGFCSVCYLQVGTCLTRFLFYLCPSIVGLTELLF
jgi:hypothetical protein